LDKFARYYSWFLLVATALPAAVRLAQPAKSQMTGDFAAVTDGAGDNPGPNAHCVGGVGLDGRNAGQEEGREGDETAAAGNGIGDSGDQGRDEQEECVVQVHGSEFQVSGFKFQAQKRERAGRGREQEDSGSCWCERGDSNPHGLPRQILSLVRLPVPPLSHVVCNSLIIT
jgi:hypothetical protein